MTKVAIMIRLATAMAALLLGLAATAGLADEPLADTYSLRTDVDTTVLIPYTTVIEPGDGANTVAVIDQPEHGTVDYPTAYTGGGQRFTYVPAPAYVGLDSFYYRVTDEDGDFSVGLININVGNVPAAVSDDDLVVPADVMSGLDVLFNDTGFADPVIFQILQQPAHGDLSVTVQGASWQSHIVVQYTPDPGFSASDQFRYFLTDGVDVGTATVSLTVSPDTDADGLLDAFDNCPSVVNLGQEDGDGDGAGDVCDNCKLVANTTTGGAGGDQVDADIDGYGNVCDADLNNSGLTTSGDYFILRTALNTANANADLNVSGLVTSADYFILRNRLNAPPGPSGLSCAGTVPCPSP
jgi:hypothetical protein